MHGGTITLKTPKAAALVTISIPRGKNRGSLCREKQSACRQEKFKTLIGGQALDEGILMQGPDKRAIVVRGPGGAGHQGRASQKEDEHSDMAAHPRRGQFRILHGQRREGADVFGGLLPGGRGRAVEIRPLAGKKLGSEKLQQVVVSLSVVLGVAFSVGLFFPASDLLAGLIPRAQGARRAAACSRA